MKLFLKLLALVLVLGLSGPFFLRGPDGQPWLDYRDFVPNLSAMGRKARTMAENITDNEPTVQPLTAPASGEQSSSQDGDDGLYRWRDADGQWHFSDQVPTGNQSP
jgi:hypothetical protein